MLHLQFTVAIFQPFVSKSCDFPAGAAGARSARTTSVLKKCDFPAGAAAASAYYVCT